MQQTKKDKALVCIDFINEMVTEGGKLTGKGYLTFVEKNQTLQNLKSLQDMFRKNDLDILHVRVSFSEKYIDHPEASPLFGKAKEFKALASKTWGTDFAEIINPLDGEKIIEKRRVSAFYSTDLETTLRSRGINTIYLAGVSTDLAVESAARDAHDRDFKVVVVSDCCAAANIEDHNKSLMTLQKIASIVTVDKVEI